MHVLVTGGSGQVGRATITELLAHGHTVVSADRVRPADRPTAYRAVELELTDVGQTADAMRGCEAVVHLGAIPTAYENPDEVVFTRNTAATFAVLQAASLVGVRRIVFASSLAAIGTAYAEGAVYPRFAPIDETHPLEPADPYGLSKLVDEQTGAMFSRRFGLQVIALRFALVADGETLRRLGQELTADPGPGFLDRVFWAYVDVRDAASALCASIEADLPGFTPLVISADDTLTDHPTAELVSRFAPACERRAELLGTAAAVSTTRARELIGWRPQHSWHDG